MPENKPIVKLIAKPNNLLKTIYTACRTCYSADSPINIYDNTDDEEKMLKLINRVISSGHYSTIEHIQISFAISNVSRACTHQLVRHRHMSFSQKTLSSKLSLKNLWARFRKNTWNLRKPESLRKMQDLYSLMRAQARLLQV